MVWYCLVSVWFGMVWFAIFQMFSASHQNAFKAILGIFIFFSLMTPPYQT